MPERMEPVTLTSSSVAPAWASAGDLQAGRHAAGVGELLGGDAGELGGRRIARRVGTQGDGARGRRAGAAEVGQQLPDHTLDDGPADIAVGFS